MARYLYTVGESSVSGCRSTSRLLSQQLTGGLVDVGFEESTEVQAVSFARVLVLFTECPLHHVLFFIFLV